MEEKKLYNAVRKIITLADGRQIEIETGKLAKQADGSVVVKMGDTMLLGTVVAAKDAKPDTDFMPLQVEYKEKYAAVGRFPGGFMKREARANDSEVLVARLIDRALRPLFPADYHAEVYVTVNLISADKDIQPDALAGLAASAALAVSDIPFGGPISEVRVVRRNGEYAINPTYSEMPECDLDIMVGVPPFMEVLKKNFFKKKLSKTFGGYDKISYLCIRFRKRWQDINESSLKDLR